MKGDKRIYLNEEQEKRKKSFKTALILRQNDKTKHIFPICIYTCENLIFWRFLENNIRQKWIQVVIFL